MYGIWSPTKFKDALLAVVSSDRLYHPIKDYFATLHWDGQERIDTLLIDYFGAKDSPYTRAVIRKTLVAAVARIYKPGVKFDSILVLNGPQEWENPPSLPSLESSGFRIPYPFRI